LAEALEPASAPPRFSPSITAAAGTMVRRAMVFLRVLVGMSVSLVLRMDKWDGKQTWQA
jgi:hypothetical protein